MPSYVITVKDMATLRQTALKKRKAKFLVALSVQEIIDLKIAIPRKRNASTVLGTRNRRLITR